MSEHEETFDAVVQRLMPIWRLRASSQAEPLMRLINCLDSCEDVNLSGIERDLIVCALAAALRPMPLQDCGKPHLPMMRAETTPEMLDLARRLVLERPSTSYIQRKLAIGYNHACEIMEYFEAQGLVSAAGEDGKRVILAEEGTK